MGLFDTARSMMDVARDKATEILGEDGMEQLKSLKDDVVNAGEQVRQVAKEVRDDCGTEAFDDARDFYSGVAKKTSAGVKENIRKAEEYSRKQKAEREAARRRREAEREAKRARNKKLLRRAGIVFLCLILTALLVLSGALWYSQHYGGGRVAEPQTGTVTAAADQMVNYPDTAEPEPTE